MNNDWKKEYILKEIADPIIKNTRQELLLELLSIFNDYDMPLIMTPDEVREQLMQILDKEVTE